MTVPNSDKAKAIQGKKAILDEVFKFIHTPNTPKNHATIEIQIFSP